MERKTLKDIPNDEIEKKLFDILNSDSARGEINVILKLAEDSCKRITYSRLLSADKMYKHLEKNMKKAREIYESTEFTDEQKDVVEEYIAAMGEVNFECTQNAYASGILDGYRILKALGVTNE